MLLKGTVGLFHLENYSVRRLVRESRKQLVFSNYMVNKFVSGGYGADAVVADRENNFVGFIEAKLAWVPPDTGSYVAKKQKFDLLGLP